MAESAPLLRVYRLIPIEGSNPSLSAIFRFYGGLLAVLFLCASCDKHKDQNTGIHWQLPLQSSNDTHASSNEVLPDWASQEEGSVVLTLLHRNTAKTTRIALNRGEKTSVGNWNIRVLGLAHGLRIQSGSFLDDPDVENPAAFVELRLHDLVVYRGWLYRDFPELFGLDNPNWKVWLKEVTFRALSKEGE